MYTVSVLKPSNISIFVDKQHECYIVIGKLDLKVFFCFELLF